MEAYTTVFTPGSTTDGDEIFFRISGPLSSATLRKARFRVEKWGASVKVCIGLQYSDDGVTYSTAAFFSTGSSPNYAPVWITADGAYYSNLLDLVNNFAISGTTRPTEDLFLRIGVWALNNSGTTSGEICSAQVRISLEPEETVGGSITSAPFPAITGGASQAEIFTPLLAPMSMMDMNYVRGSVEIASVTNSVEVKVAYQKSDDGGITWSSATAIGSWVTSTGVTPGSSWTNVNFDAESTNYTLVRWGFTSRNHDSMDSVMNMFVATLRLDWRQE